MGNNTTKKAIVINNIRNCLLNDIKSKYIREIIFGYLNTKKILQLIKYNKKLQKKINITINDYENFIIENKIEIELQIDKYQEEKEEKNYFINFEKEDKPFIHIYLNNNNKETKRNYIKKEEFIPTIKIILDLKFKKF